MEKMIYFTKIIRLQAWFGFQKNLKKKSLIPPPPNPLPPGEGEFKGFGFLTGI
jgi:hypothetical protein